MSDESCENILAAYRKAGNELRSSIKKYKLQRWKNIIETVEEDVWGDGYKIVCKRAGLRLTIGLPKNHSHRGSY